jgi:hypothetical protein
MRKNLWTPLLLLSLAPFLNSASAQFQLVPLSTFGTNSDGTVRPGQEAFLTSDTLQRGMAYNPTTGHLLVANRSPLGAETIAVVDGDYGTNITSLQGFTSVIGGHADFVLNMVGVSDDGSIYVGNLTTTPVPPQFRLYRWSSENATESTPVFIGDPSNGAATAGDNRRWGDTMSVRGSGTSTEVLIASRGTLVAILRPTDASLSTFTATTFNLAVPNDSLGYAVAFGPGNTFFAKSASSDGKPLYLIAYDYGTSSATVSNVWTTSQFPGRVGAIGVNLASNMMAAVEMTAGGANDIARLYDISTIANPPAFLDRQEFYSTNANNIFAGVVAWGTNGNIYMLDTGNGLVAYSVAAGAVSLPVRIFQQPTGKVMQITSNYVFTVGADGSLPLTYQWQFNSNDIAGATSDSLPLNNLATTNDGYYSVIVSNSLGAVTSAVAKLTVVPRYGDLVVYDPFDYTPGSTLNNVGGWSITSAAENGTIEAGNLSVPGLRASVGNRYTLTGSTSIRKPFGEYLNGIVYCSFVFRLDNPSTSSGNETFAGFALGGTGTTFPMKFNLIGSGSGTYQIGLYKGGGVDSGAIAPNVFTASDTVLIVGRYVFGPGTTDDLCDMWVNPDPMTFGAATAPAPTVAGVGNGKLDAAAIDRFFMRWASGYPKRTYDEIRVGFSWAEVTPSVPPTLTITPRWGITMAGIADISWPTNFSPTFELQSIGSLFGDPDGWLPVTTAVVVQGTNYTVPVQTGSGQRFFRLKQ